MSCISPSAFLQQWLNSQSALYWLTDLTTGICQADLTSPRLWFTVLRNSKPDSFTYSSGLNVSSYNFYFLVFTPQVPVNEKLLWPSLCGLAAHRLCKKCISKADLELWLCRQNTSTGLGLFNSKPGVFSAVEQHQFYLTLHAG